MTHAEPPPIVEPQLDLPLWVSDLPVLQRAVRVYSRAGLTGRAAVRRAEDMGTLARMDDLLARAGELVHHGEPERDDDRPDLRGWLQVSTFLERPGQHLVDVYSPGADGERTLCGAVVGFVWDTDRGEPTCLKCLHQVVPLLLGRHAQGTP